MMKQLAIIPLLLAAGCTQWGFIGESGGRADPEGLRFDALELAGATSVARTVVTGDRADDDGVVDQAFHFAWNLADCHDDECLPIDAGEARTHVFRIRATDSSGEVAYKKVTVTLYP